jgi:hypothetical protein
MKMLERKQIKLKRLTKLILVMFLTGCTRINYKHTKIVLPEMPLAGEEVAKEIEKYCIDYTRCPKTLDWLTRLYWFRIEYSAFQEELSKS